jgi:hypothetical protein
MVGSSHSPNSPETVDDAPFGPHAELLQRVDENLWCRAINDNPAHEIDLSGALLFQVPAVAEIHRHLSRWESSPAETAPARWQPSVTRMIDALFEHLVETEAVRPAEAGLAPPAHVIRLLERVAAMLATLDQTASTGPGV